MSVISNDPSDLIEKLSPIGELPSESIQEYLGGGIPTDRHGILTLLPLLTEIVLPNDMIAGGTNQNNFN